MQTIDEQLPKKIEVTVLKLSHSDMQAVLAFAEGLLQKKEMTQTALSDGKKRNLEPLKGAFGKMSDDFDAPAGIFVLPLPKDFDAPLDCFKDYTK